MGWEGDQWGVRNTINVMFKVLNKDYPKEERFYVRRYERFLVFFFVFLKPITSVLSFHCSFLLFPDGGK